MNHFTRRAHRSITEHFLLNELISQPDHSIALYKLVNPNSAMSAFVMCCFFLQMVANLWLNMNYT